MRANGKAEGEEGRRRVTARGAARPRVPLSPGHRIPLRRQIAASLADAIREGELPGGTRLPSTRRWAPELGVHRHTLGAAYRELVEGGLARSVPGSGVFVAGRAHASDEGGATLRAHLARARAAGRSAAEVAADLERWRAAALSRRVLVVEPEPELRSLLVLEVSRACPVAVDARSLGALRGDPGLVGRAVPVAREPVARRLREVLPSWCDLVPLRCSGGRRALASLGPVPPGSVVALLTLSPTVRRQALELAAGLEPRIALAAPDPTDGPAVERALRVARRVLADALCARRPPVRGLRRAIEFRLLTEESARALRTWFAPAAGARPGSAGLREEPREEPR